MNEIGKDLTPRQVVAYTIWGEARGECLSGKMAVACCIFTRAFKLTSISPYGPDGETDAVDFLSYVCLKPGMFDCWKDGVFQQESPPIYYHKEYDADQEYVLEMCELIADELFQPNFVPLTQITHYYAMTMAKAPYWAAKMDFVGKFGNQLFYYDKNWRG